MRSQPYEQTEIVRLLPLLESIGREIHERTDALAQVEARIEELRARADARRLLHAEGAEAANQRRGLRLARKELERLGCELVDAEPLTFRIPGKEGDETRDFVWQARSTCLQ